MNGTLDGSGTSKLPPVDGERKIDENSAAVVVDFLVGDDHEQIEHRFAIPLDEMEACLQAEQMSRLRAAHTFAGLTQAGDLMFNAKVRVVEVLPSKPHSATAPEQMAEHMAHEGESVVQRSGRSAKRLKLRSARQPALIAPLFRITISIGDPADGVSYSSSCELDELVAKLPRRHAKELRLLRSFALLQNVDGVSLLAEFITPSDRPAARTARPDDEQVTADGFPPGVIKFWKKESS